MSKVSLVLWNIKSRSCKPTPKADSRTNSRKKRCSCEYSECFPKRGEFIATPRLDKLTDFGEFSFLFSPETLRIHIKKHPFFVNPFTNWPLVLVCWNNSWEYVRSNVSPPIGRNGQVIGPAPRTWAKFPPLYPDSHLVIRGSFGNNATRSLLQTHMQKKSAREAERNRSRAVHAYGSSHSHTQREGNKLMFSL